MNAVQIHMLVNHIPIIGFGVALVVVAGGWIFKSRALLLMGLFLTAGTGLTALPANFSGEEAEEIVEEFPGVSHSAIHEHEEAAELSLILILVSAGISALGLFLVWKEKPVAKFVTPALLALGIFALVTIVRTGHLGGLIRHPEITNTTPAAEAPGEHGGGSHVQPDGD